MPEMSEKASIMSFYFSQFCPQALAQICTARLLECRLRLQFSHNEIAAGIVANAKDARLSFGFAEFDTS
jgi:hypothetical protein